MTMLSQVRQPGRVPALTPGSARAPRAQRLICHASTSEEGTGTNVGAFCSIDGSGKRLADQSLAEKEASFLEALQSYYYEGKSNLTDEEFENLKDDLLWSGSKVAVLSSDEQRFMEATMSYNRGKPILSDEEYDELRAELKAKDSVVVAAGPRCSIRSRKLYSDAKPDYLKMTLLNVPAALLVLGFIFAIDDITGFEITKAIELPPPYSILFLWGLVFPTIYVISTSLTNIVLPDALILTANCPNCNTENQAYFGGIFNIEGNRKETIAVCKNCKADLKYTALRREVTVEKSGEEKAAEAEEKKRKKAEAAAARKKAAAAAANK